MGKGARARRQRKEQEQAAINWANLPANKKAIMNEVNNQLAVASERFYRDELSVILWVLYTTYGFGKIRLKRFVTEYETQWKQLRDWYQLLDKDVSWVCREKLKEIGVDLDAEEWQ